MKKTLAEPDLSLFPKKLHELALMSDIYDSSCSADARVWFFDRDGGYYLKRAENGSLLTEARMTEYLNRRGVAPRVLDYISDGTYDWMLTRAAVGEDCVHKSYLSQPERLCDKLGEAMRALHETDPSFCPVQNRTRLYLDTAEKNYRAGIFDAGHSEKYKDAQYAWSTVEDGRSLLREDTLIHGDFCLPNVVIDRWCKVTFIDVDHAGVGDAHVDLYWCAWSLHYNLGTDRYRDRLFDAYGRDRIDKDVLRVIEAIETFG